MSHYRSTRSVEKKLHNQSQANYPTFDVHPSYYEVVFINHHISSHMLDQLLTHVGTCKQYSIDTESERNNNKLSLIQINSIPATSKSFVMLLELNHFPDHTSYKYEKISALFRLIFRPLNEIYSWGNMRLELENAKQLVPWPIPATLIDLQPHFPDWYNWARTQCRVQDLTYRQDTNLDNATLSQHHEEPTCTCHPPSPYRMNELWSLQKAFMYGCRLFLDKSCTLSHWSASLTSRHSSLSQQHQRNMIRYAINDVVAVTYLIKPIVEYWKFEQLVDRPMNEMFVAFKSIDLRSLSAVRPTHKKIKNLDVQKLSTILTSHDPDLESISSDDEIYLSQVNQPVPNDYHPPVEVKYCPIDNDVAIPAVDVTTCPAVNQLTSANSPTGIVHEVIQSPIHQEQKQKKKRSHAARRHKNRKRNLQLRLHRYRHYFTRPFYYRFKSKLIRQVLRHYGVQFRHIKFVDDQVIIGVKHDRARNEFDTALPRDCFNKKNYHLFRR